MTGPVRGYAAHQEVADAARQNRGGGFSRLLTLKPGEKLLARFRGFTRRLPEVGVDRLRGMTVRELRDLCALWAVWDKVEGADVQNALVERLLERQTHLEPLTLVEDYIHGNSAGRQYVTCATVWGGVPCVACKMKDQGDKRISQKVSAVFAVVPHRRYHYTKDERDPKKSDFAYCANYGYDSPGRCQYCARRLEAKQEGIQRFPLASMHAAGVVAAAERMGKRCAACDGVGMIQHAMWSCNTCGEPHDADALKNAAAAASVANKSPTWIGDMTVTCRACRAKGFPIEEVTCSRRCAAARRAHLFDADILIERIGADKKTTYAFNEQFPFAPASEDILKHRVPNWEAVLKPGSVERQCNDIGVRVNPFSGEAIGPAGPAQGAVPYDDAPHPGDPAGYAPGTEDIPF